MQTIFRYHPKSAEKYFIDRSLSRGFAGSFSLAFKIDNICPYRTRASHKCWGVCRYYKMAATKF